MTDIIVGGIFLLVLGLAVIFYLKRRKKGGCGCSCGDGENCCKADMQCNCKQ